MKKFLLSALAGLISLGSFALDTASLPTYSAEVADYATDVQEQEESRAAGAQIKFCGSIYGWLKQPTACDEIKVYVPVPAEVATTLAGNKVTKITFSADLKSATTLPGTIFVTENPYGEDATCTEVTVRNSNITGSTTKAQTATLEEPYKIKAGTPFYIGYSVKGFTANDGIIGACNNYSVLAGFVQPIADGESLGFGSLGYDLFVYAATEGSKTTLDGAAMVIGTSANGFTLPVVTVGSEVKAQLNIWNFGSALRSAEYSYISAQGDTVSSTASVLLTARTTSTIGLPVDPATLGRNEVRVMVNKLGDYEQTTVNADVAVIGVPATSTLQRKYVVEEFTGTWCGWCPRGIVGFEKMEAAHPDEFIGIAVHSGDNMEVDCYSSVLNQFCEGYPSCVVNRDGKFVFDPSYSYLNSNYVSSWSKQKAPVAIEWGEVAFNADSTAIIANLSTVFEYDEADAQYDLALVITEDSIADIQTNYYGIGEYGTMDGWEKKGTSVVWSYSHVARQVTYESSTNTNVEAGVPNPAIIEAPLTNVYKLKNIEQIVALVLDRRTGVVLNGSSIPLSEVKEASGIKAVSTTATATATGGAGCINIDGTYRSVAVYTLSGAAVGRTTDLAPGVYIVNIDGRAQKAAVR